MRYTIMIATICALGFTGCTNQINTIKTPTIKPKNYQKPTAAKSAKFNHSMVKVALSTREDTRYNKMKLDSPEKKAWFKDLMYRLWDRQITRNQFIAEGLSKYPTRKYEFTFVANGFQKY